MSRIAKMAALAAALLTTATAAPARAAYDHNYYGAVSIANRTDSTLHYVFRWGDREWQEVTLAPGEVCNHAWQYDYTDQNSSPRFEVRFDADMSAGTYWKVYDLTPYASPTSGYDYSHKYVFRYCGYRELDLYPVN